VDFATKYVFHFQRTWNSFWHGLLCFAVGIGFRQMIKYGEDEDDEQWLICDF